MSRAAKLAGMAALTVYAGAAALNSTLRRSQARVATCYSAARRGAADKRCPPQERTSAALRAPAGSSAEAVAEHMRRAADGGLASAELASALEQVGPYAPRQRPSDNDTPAHAPR